MKVYLAGTITKDPAHLKWREKVKNAVDGLCDAAGDSASCLSPLRYQNPKKFTAGGLHDKGTPDSFFVRNDIADLHRSDIMFAVYWRDKVTDQLRGYRRQSVGTWIEMGIAVERHMPIILVTDDPEVAGHPFPSECAAVVCGTLEEGIGWLEKALS